LETAVNIKIDPNIRQPINTINANGYKLLLKGLVFLI